MMRIERDRLVELGECFFGPSGSRQRLAARRGGVRIAHIRFGWSRLRRGFRLRRQRSQIDRAAAERDRDRYSQRSERARTEAQRDRKSTRLNSSHLGISYAVFCLK